MVNRQYKTVIPEGIFKISSPKWRERESKQTVVFWLSWESREQRFRAARMAGIFRARQLERRELCRMRALEVRVGVSSESVFEGCVVHTGWVSDLTQSLPDSSCWSWEHNKDTRNWKLMGDVKAPALPEWRYLINTPLTPVEFIWNSGSPCLSKTCCKPALTNLKSSLGKICREDRD